MSDDNGLPAASAGNQTPRKGRGGSRPGAGRKRKDHVPPAALAKAEVKAALAAEPTDEIESVAQRHAVVAFETLARKLTDGFSEAARVAAANAILDRGFGKPAVDVGGETLPLPFGQAPDRALGNDIRARARRYAPLAIEVLRKIAVAGASESASVSAAKSLLDRGLGTVAAAKVPDEVYKPAPLGKKEEAQRAADAAATGRYAPPRPPGGAALQ